MRKAYINKFIFCNSDFISFWLMFEFLSHSSDFISCHSEFISHIPEFLFSNSEFILWHYYEFLYFTIRFFYSSQCRLYVLSIFLTTCTFTSRISDFIISCNFEFISCNPDFLSHSSDIIISCNIDCVSHEFSFFLFSFLSHNSDFLPRNSNILILTLYFKMIRFFHNGEKDDKKQMLAEKRNGRNVFISYFWHSLFPNMMFLMHQMLEMLTW